MGISKVTVSNDKSQAEFAWRSLRRFQNTEYVSSLIMERHKVSKKFKSNVDKQAGQIKLTLALAQEYSEAASTVSLATKPVLLYYSAMNLALAEVLLKQSGNSSLDKAREQHRHHGLVSTVGNVLASQNLKDSALQMRAKPMIDSTSGERKGTFELWRRSAQQHPSFGVLENRDLSINRKTILSNVGEETLPDFPKEGLTLLDCIKNIPGAIEPLYEAGIHTSLLRGSSKLTVQGQETTYTYLLQPTVEDRLEAYLESFRIPAALVPYVEVRGVEAKGAIVNLGIWAKCPHAVKLPDVINSEKGENYYLVDGQPLNEFGYLYVALFIAGNYARYYPDYWTKDRSFHSELCQFIEVIVDAGLRRLPLLTLTELSEKLYVFE